MDKRPRERERNPITGDGMCAKDSQANIPHLRARQPSPMQYGSDDYTDSASVASFASAASEEEPMGGSLTPPETPAETHSTVQETSSVPASLDQTPPRSVSRQPKQRERNPITGDGMTDRDYRAAVPSFKIHGPQRKEGNPLNLDGYARNDRVYRSHVQEASVSPLTRVEGRGAITTTDEDPPPPSPSRQRQRDRNPITGYGMEDRDFRVQIPTFKIHGPQRQSGDPLTGAGYAVNDKEYQRQVHDASDSPLSSPPSRN